MAKKETFKDPWLLRVPPPFIFKISEFFPHNIFMISTIPNKNNC